MCWRGVQSLGQDRFLVVTPDEERMVEGFDPARQFAHTVGSAYPRPTYLLPM